MSEIRKSYFARFFWRCFVLVFFVVLYFVMPASFDILDGMNFFSGFSVFHIIWVLWVIDMLLQIIPSKSKIALGSQKLFAFRFRPVREMINTNVLKSYTRSIGWAAFRVLLLWILLIAAIGAVYYLGIIGRSELFLITVLFYVFDLVCVLFWCPFRLLMHTKCCTTCRIFNWDHIMMFSPVIFLTGFYTLSLVVLACVALLIWELSILIHPERFCEKTNEALKCTSCTDKLCTQYCQKLRKPTKQEEKVG